MFLVGIVIEHLLFIHRGICVYCFLLELVGQAAFVSMPGVLPCAGVGKEVR